MVVESVNIIKLKEFKRTEVSLIEGKIGVCIITALDSYIPIEEFKEVFNYIGNEVVVKYGIVKLIFDKRNLHIFHQPSMEWYFIEWKEKMYELGLTVHRKILPEDEVFKQSVKLGRLAIERKFPNGKYKNMDIQYAESIEEALEN